MFRLPNSRFIVGYALGDDGMLFRGELLTDSIDDDARREALDLANYWSEIDADDEANPHRGPGRWRVPRLVTRHGWGDRMIVPPDTTAQRVNNTLSHSGETK